MLRPEQLSLYNEIAPRRHHVLVRRAAPAAHRRHKGTTGPRRAPHQKGGRGPGAGTSRGAGGVKAGSLRASRPQLTDSLQWVLGVQKPEMQLYCGLAMKTFTLSALLLLTLKSPAQECYDLSTRSSWISVVCYSGGTLSIVMTGSRYNFCGVPYDLFQGLLRASSPGTYYDNYIRGRYRCSGY